MNCVLGNRGALWLILKVEVAKLGGDIGKGCIRWRFWGCFRGLRWWWWCKLLPLENFEEDASVPDECTRHNEMNSLAPGLVGD